MQLKPETGVGIVSLLATQFCAATVWAQSVSTSEPAKLVPVTAVSVSTRSPRTNTTNQAFSAGQTLDGLSLSGSSYIIDFSSSSLFTVKNLLSISKGTTIYAISSNPEVQSATIRANSILNSGLITTVLPASGLPGYSGLIPSLSLTLIATNSLTNQGTISSAANLNIIAGQINNAPSAQAPHALMQAANSLNIFSNNIFNAGTLKSINGNVNINTTSTYDASIAALMNGASLSNFLGSTMNLSGTGVISALKGNINVGSGIEQILVNINGGNFLSNQLSVSAGCGNIEMAVGEITGTLNTYAASVHQSSTSSILTLGEINVTGDPTYYNTGSINISGNIAVGEDLAIISGGDITAVGGEFGPFYYMRARDNNGQGYNIQLIAGASVGPCGTCSTDGKAGSEATGNVTISGPSPTGGDVVFSGNNSLIIDTSSKGYNQSGGNITIAAFANGSQGGRITLSPVSILVSSGTGVGNNGNITLIAGATSGTAISTGRIITDGGSGNAPGTGDVRLIGSQPVSSDGKPITFNTSGKIISGNQLVGSSVLQPTSITLNATISASHNISIEAGSDVKREFYFGKTPGATITAIPILSPDRILLSKNGTLMYVLQNHPNDNLPYYNVIETKNNSLIASVRLPAYSSDIELSPNGSKLYVLGTGDLGDTSGVTIFDTNTNQKIGSMTSPSSGQRHGFLALNPSGSLLYVSNYNQQTGKASISVFDTATNSEVATISSGMTSPNDMIFNQSGTKAYVSNQGSIEVLDTSNYSVIGHIVDLSGPGLAAGKMVLSPDESRLYIAQTNQVVQTIDTSTLKVSPNFIVVGNAPNAIAMSADGSYLYVLNYSDMSVINTGTNKLVSNIPVGSQNIDIALSPNGKFAYAAGRFPGFINEVALSAAVFDNGINNYGVLAAKNVSIATQNGNIGISSLPLLTSADSISLNLAGANKDVFLSPLSGSLVLGDSNVTGKLSLNTAGSLSIDGKVVAGTASLFANGNLNINGSLTTTSGDLILGTLAKSNASLNINGIISSAANVSISADGAGNINQTADIIGKSVTLNSTSGNINLQSNVNGTAGVTVASTGTLTLKNVHGSSITVNTTPALGGNSENPIILTGILDTSSTTANGNGGNISLTAETIAFKSGSAVVANGSGTGNGGTVTLKGDLQIAPDTTAQISSNGGSSGSGGVVSLALSSSSDVSIGDATGELKLDATGGAPGSASGNAGRTSIDSYGQLHVAASGIEANPLGLNGSGADLQFKATNLTLTGSSLSANGSGTGSGGKISLTGYSTLDLSAGLLSADSTDGPAGAVSIQSDSLKVSSSEISASSTNGNGGTVILSSQTLISTNISPLLISANGGGAESGGTVSIAVNDLQNGNLTVGTKSGELVLSATGGSSGSSAGNGGTVILTAAKTLLVDPSSISAQPLGINGDGATLQFSGATNNASTVQIKGSSLCAEGAGSGKGGKISIAADSISIDTSSVEHPEEPVQDEISDGIISVNAGSNGSSAGELSIVSNSSTALTIRSFSISAIAGKDGGNIDILSKKSGIELNVTSISADSTESGNGGKIFLRANSTFTSKSGSALVVSADASNSGNGGYIQLEAFDTTEGDIYVGDKAGEVRLFARGGSPGSLSGNGGKIGVLSGHSLILDSQKIIASPRGINGNGGFYLLCCKTVQALNGIPDAERAGSGSSGGIITSSSQTERISSLDLTDPAVVSYYVQKQTEDPLQFGGKLIVDGGIAVGGNLILSPNSLDQISAQNIPAGVTLTFVDWYGYGAFYAVQLTESSSTKTLTINGTQEYVSAFGNSNPSIYVSNKLATDTIYIGGTIRSEDSLTIAASGGTVTFGESASVSAKNTLNINLQTDGKLNIDGKLTGSKEMLISAVGPIFQSSKSVISTALLRTEVGEVSTSEGMHLLGQNQISAWAAGNNNGTWSGTPLIELNNTVPLNIMGGQALGEVRITNTQAVTVTGENIVGSSFTYAGFWMGRGGVITSPTINLPGKLLAGYGYSDIPQNIVLQGNGPDNSLIVNFEAGGMLRAVGGELKFNTISPGPVTINSSGNSSIAFANTMQGVPSTEQLIIMTVVQNGGNGSISSGGDLTVSAAAPGRITVETTTPLEFSGNTQFQNKTLIHTYQSLGATANASVDITGDLTISASSVVNPNAFHATGTVVINVPGAGIVNTIVNPYGDLLLSKNMQINTNGENLVLMAAGHVIGNDLASINLSSASKSGGNLTVLAGVDFSSNPPYVATGQTADDTTIFSLTGPSKTGGNVNLATTTINTSSASSNSANNSGGTVILVANSGTNASGVILSSAINSSSVHGSGGKILVSSPGGIIINGSIKSSGPTGGGSVTLSTTPVTLSGTKILGGNILQGSIEPAVVQSPGVGSSINVKGEINTSAGFTGGQWINSNGSMAGSININADLSITVGPIITSGRVGGSVDISSKNAEISINGALNTAGLQPLSTLDFICTNCGDGGNVSLSAGQNINITGNVIATGASSIVEAGYFASRAGNGGNLNIQTMPRITYYSGNVAIKGYINVSGGNATLPDYVGMMMPAGNGGAIQIVSAAMQVAGTIKVPNVGTASIIASAGAFSGPTTKAGSNGSVVIATYAFQGIPSSLNLSSTAKSEYALPGGLFSVGEVGPLVNGTKSNIVVGKMVVSSKTSSAGVTAGNIADNSFYKTELVDYGYKAGFIALGANGGGQTIQYSGGSTLITAGTPGHRTKITPGQALALYQIVPGGIQTVGLNAAGQVTSIQPNGMTSTLSIPQYDLPKKITAFNLIAQGQKSGIQLNITGDSPLLDLSAASIRSVFGELNFVSTSNISVIKTGSSAFTIPEGGKISANTDLFLIGASVTNKGSINAAKLIVIPAASTFTFSNGSTGIVNADRLFLSTATNSVTINNTGGSMSLPIEFGPLQFSTFIGSPFSAANTAAKLNLTFKMSGDGAHLTGSLSPGVLNITTKPVLVAKVLTPTLLTFDSGTNIKATGAITVNSGAIRFEDSTNISSSAGIKMIATTGNIEMGSNNKISANGGNLIMLAKQKFSGEDGNQFIANVPGIAGGGIELGAGITASKLTASLSKLPGTVNGPFATNFVLNNPISGQNSSGVLQSNFSNSASGTSSINLSSGTNQADLTLHGGAIVLDSNGVGNTLQIDGANITVTALKPISFVSAARAKVVLDSVNDSFKLVSGELFLNAKNATTINCDIADIHTKRGAIVSLCRDESGLRVINCRASGDVTVVVGSERLSLAAGEELIISPNLLNEPEKQKSDGVGRRNFSQFKFASGMHGTFCDVSLISMLCNVPHLRGLSHPTNGTEKQVLGKMLKAACSVQTVTSKRGAYKSSPKLSKELAI